MDLLSLVYDVGQWVIRLAMIPVIARDNRPSVGWAWLAFVAFVPWVAMPAYLLLGRPPQRRRTRRRRLARERLRTLDGEGAERAADSTGDPVAPDQAAPGLGRMVEALTEMTYAGLEVVGGNLAELVDSTDAAVDALVADLDAARSHAHLLFYLFNGDETGWRVARALARAAERGVACRVLVDAFGSRVEASPPFFAEIGPWLNERGVEARAVHAQHLWRRLLARFDLRNHRKLAVIDGQVGWVGSLNLHDADFELDDGGVWEQVMARLEGPVVQQLQWTFAEDWQLATDRALPAEVFSRGPRRGEVMAQAVPGGSDHDREPVQHLLVGAVASARETLVITTPYLVPDEPLQIALRIAALRGVRVSVVVPARSDRAVADAAARAYFVDLLDAGVEIRLHAPGFLHAKTMTVDDQVAIVGSANYDRRSLFLNDELNVVLYDQSAARRLRQIQERLMTAATALDREWWGTQPRWRRQLWQVAKLLSPVL